MKMTVHLQTVSCASTAEQEKGAAVFLNITHTSPLTVGPDGGVMLARGLELIAVFLGIL